MITENLSGTLCLENPPPGPWPPGTVFGLENFTPELTPVIFGSIDLLFNLQELRRSGVPCAYVVLREGDSVLEDTDVFKYELVHAEEPELLFKIQISSLGASSTFRG